MTAIVGFFLVILFVFGGYAISGGSLPLIFKPWYEYVIILGSALGGLVVKTSPRTLKLVVAKAMGAFTTKLPGKEMYMESLKLIHDLAYLARREGLLALESHVQNPSQSTIFSKYPLVSNKPQVLKFLTDNLKIVVVGGTNPSDLESLMDTDIETVTEENATPQALINNVADALPALGIVAAVLGIIKTMASIAEGPEVVGHKVASALVGTFLGVLFAYGFVGPLATNIEMTNLEEKRLLEVFKTGILGITRGMNPKLSAEYARRAIYDGLRPSFEELEEALKG